MKSGAELYDLYCRSVGRGASFLLNVPPDRRGLLHENDVAALQDFGRRVRGTFAKNLAGRPDGENTVDARGAFNVVRLRERIAEGQRIDAFTVEGQFGAEWRPLAEGTSVGACRILRLPEAVEARRVRLRVGRSSGPVLLKEFGLYRESF